MPKHSKVNACLALLLAVLFYLFFQLCKQQPALSQVNAFADDPYDAVGSFGTQFAMFVALLSMVRAFRPYQPNRAMDSQQVLLERGAYMTCLAVAVTLGTDIVALFRFPSVWVGFPAGSLLAVLSGGMVVLTALVGWRVHHTSSTPRASSTRLAWARAIGVSLMSVIILAWYPERFTQSSPGEPLTIVGSVILLFAIVWAWGVVLSPSLQMGDEDLLDDLASIYGWLKAHSGRFSTPLALLERTLNSSFLRPLWNLVNPRRHRWNGILLFGLCLGVLLAYAEAMGAGGLGPRFATLALVFAGFEGAGVLVGYIFLAGPLRLFRSAHLSITR